MTPYRYPLDKTGTHPDNLVVDEYHSLANLTAKCIAPTYGNFYTQGVIIKDHATKRVLRHGVDYMFGEIQDILSERYAKEICAYIVIVAPNVTAVDLTYQALGGEYSYSMGSLIDMLESLQLDERPVKWGSITDKPVDFEPHSHWHKSSDLYGMEYVVHSIERLRNAVLMGDVASHDEIYRYIDRTSDEIFAIIQTLRNDFELHKADKNNPHSVTKAQVGLGSVQNYGMATKAEAEAGTVSTKYTSPLTVAQAIDYQAGVPLRAHIARVDNPHSVTKAQVGLGSVENYAISTEAEARAGTVNTKYMTPLRTSQAIFTQALTPLNSHLADKSNPHSVTKAQVGLGSVENYGVSTQAEAEAGTISTKYMTPLRTAQAITKQAVVPLNEHIANKSNPHAVTKAQVGLGSVLNYGVATRSDAEVGTSNSLYMTPLRTAEAIDYQAGAPMRAHIARVDNPHNVTKAQVGLGSVQNYGIATKAEAETGTSNAKYMTPLRVSEAITKQVRTAYEAHAANTSNPHSVTKAQVGLSVVENYPVASRQEAEGGTASNRYMTPLLTAQAIEAIVGDDFDLHIANIQNPHSVTKAQVGLGSVQNYGVATKVEAEEGTLNSRYMTPLRVLESIKKNAITSPDFRTSVTSLGTFTSVNGFLLNQSARTGIVPHGTIGYATTASGTIISTHTATESTHTNRNVFVGSSPMVAGNEVASLTVRATGAGNENTAGIMFDSSGRTTKLALRNDGVLGIGGGDSPAWLWYLDGNGNCVTAGDTSIFSDPKLKENKKIIVKPEDLIEGLDCWSFDWKDLDHNGPRRGKSDIGFMADQVRNKLPMFVNEQLGDDGVTYSAVAYSKFTPILVAIANNHQKEINELKAKISALTNATL